nr:RodZ domain-containing protein [Myxacorys almedinensis]
MSEERQHRSVSLQEVAAKTYIPLRLLNAIEAGRMDLLPEPVFVQGFIRRYADLLGLDGTSISKEFPLNASPVPPDVLKTVAPPPVPETLVPKLPQPDETIPASSLKVERPDPVERPTSPKPPGFESEGLSSKLPWIVGGIAGIGAIALLASLLTSPPDANQNPATSIKPVSGTTAQPSPISPPGSASALQEQPTAASPTAAPAATAPVSVKLSLTDDSWVEIQTDGEIVFEGTLPKGTQKTWSGNNQVVVSAGNAGAVSASYNNGAAKVLGTLGDVVTTNFPPTAP